MLILFRFSPTWPVTLGIQEQVFSDCTVLLNSKETRLGSRDQEVSPSTGKDTGEVLVPCWTWKCVPTAISSSVGISEFSGYHLLQQVSSQWGSQELMSYELTVYLSVFSLFLTQLILVVILSKWHKPGNFESHKYSRPLFTFCWFWIFARIKLSWHSCSIRDKFGWLVMRGYLLLIWKNSITHMHGLAVYVKDELPFISRKLCILLLMFSTGLTSLSALLLFPLLIIFFVFIMHGFWFHSI